jgi:hypothetical protein
MTDNTASPPAEPELPGDPGPLQATADDVGLAILTTIRDELKAQKKPYIDMAEHEQDLLLRRLEVGIRNAVRRGFGVMVAADFPNAIATLDKVAFTPKGVQGTVSLAPASEHRHALSDHAGRPVLVVLATAEAYLARMEELRGEKQQQDLFKSSDGDQDVHLEFGMNSERHDAGGPATDGETGSATVTGDGTGEALAPVDDPFPGDLTREAVLALLEIATVEGVDLADVSQWDQDTRKLVADWAGARALSVSHPEVHVPPLPAVLVHDETDDEEEAP